MVLPGTSNYNLHLGKFGKPEPYSPTERNNLNKPTVSVHSRTLPNIGRSSHRDQDLWIFSDFFFLPFGLKPLGTVEGFLELPPRVELDEGSLNSPARIFDTT
jgi:hypothetical protein